MTLENQFHQGNLSCVCAENFLPLVKPFTTIIPTGFQALLCLYRSGTGGLSILVDGFKLAEEIRKSNPEHFYILSSIPLSYHLTGGGHKYLNTTPSIVLDPETVQSSDKGSFQQLPQIASLIIRHQVTVAATTWRCISNTKAVWCVKDFHGHHEKRISAVHIHLEPGNLMTFDNRRLLYQQGGLGQQDSEC